MDIFFPLLQASTRLLSDAGKPDLTWVLSCRWSYPYVAELYKIYICPSMEVVNVKVILIKLMKILTWIELPWKTLKVILLQEGSGMGHSQTAHGLFFISDLHL